MMNSNDVTFVERGLPFAFTPDRNVGVMFAGTELGDLMSWGVGVFRVTDEDLEFQGSDGWSVTARLGASPIYCDDGNVVVHLGGNYTHSTRPDNELRYSVRPEFNTAPLFVDTGVIPSENQDLVSGEAAIVVGPFSVQGEYVHSFVDRTWRQYRMPEVDFSGFYVQGSVFLTGERRRYLRNRGWFGRVRPRKNFSLKKGESGPGAVELAARYSHIDLNDEDVTGGKLQDMTFGVNWYLNPNARVTFDYIHADLEDTGDSNHFGIRLQLAF
jgi:phosphate-selective porin OprO/OprP